MTRILASLVFADTVLWVGTGVLGALVDQSRFYPQHFILAIFTIILTVLIHVIVFTYFSVTSRMISQAVFIGHLDQEPLERIKTHKRRAAVCLAVGFLSLVPVVALGALTARGHEWAWWHLGSVSAALAANLWSFFGEYECVARHSRMMGEVLERYTSNRRVN